MIFVLIREDCIRRTLTSISYNTTNGNKIVMSCNSLVKVEIDVVGGEAIARHLARLLYWQIT